MSTKTKARVVVFSILIFCMTIPLVKSCDAQCICLPLPPLPLPWWCCQQRPASPQQPTQPSACAKPMAKPTVTPCEGKCPWCPAVPKCGTCHEPEPTAPETPATDEPETLADRLKIDPNKEHGMKPEDAVVPTEMGKDAGKPCIIPPEEPEDFPLIEDLACPLEGTDEQVAECFAKINALRQRSGLPLVQMDELLCKIAQQHANRMANFRSIFHSGCGYCENVAFGHTQGVPTFEQWHRSPGHLQNMLRGGQKIGLARCGMYWVFIISR
jgi:uncharacterized protein YkwD